jgi:hypothetical protein
MEHLKERREQHQALVNYVAARLEKIGVKNLSYEAKIPDNGRVDVLGFDGNKRIAVECYVQVQPNKIEGKIAALRKAVDRLIVCAPEYEARKLDRFNVEVWPYSKARKPRRIVIKEDTYEELLRVSQDMDINKELPGITDETIRRLLVAWKKNR